MRQVKVCELVYDYTMYPRASIDSYHVSEIVQAMTAGLEMPPVVIDKATKRIVDGFHRCTAALRCHDTDATIMVVEKTYRSEQQMFLDAVRYNSAHGRNLSTYDRARCAIQAANLEIDDALLAGVLHMDVEAIDKLRRHRSAMAGKLTVPIKRTIQHKAGKSLTRGQITANEALGGMNQLFYVNQLIILIENELLDTANELLMARLSYLAKLLEEI